MHNNPGVLDLNIKISGAIHVFTYTTWFGFMFVYGGPQCN